MSFEEMYEVILIDKSSLTGEGLVKLGEAERD